MKKILVIIIIFITTLGFFTFFSIKKIIKFLDIKGTVINLKEIRILS